MVTDILFVVVGLVFLLAGGECLVRGAVGLSALLKIPSLLVGLTIVAFGTSAPELVVTIQAVSEGNNGIAIGNIVGSNIANILLILGVPALAAPICLGTKGLRRHVVVMLAATALFGYIVYIRGSLDQTMGLILLGLIVAYVLYVGWNALRPDQEDDGLIGEVEELSAGNNGVPVILGFLVLGLVGLPVGGNLLVTHGAELARALDIREELIGLTIVAFGTSLPELATVWAAAMKRQADVAVGNIIGSNIFNILFVGGAAGVAGTTYFQNSSVDGEPVSALLRLDIPVMVAATILIAAMVFARGRITRSIGAVFALLYLGYIAFVSASEAGTLPF